MENFFISEEAQVGSGVRERLELLHRRNNATIVIEKNVKISDDVIFSDVLQSLFIGQYTFIGKRTFFAFKRINIGAHCSILAGMYFGKRQMETFIPGIQKGRMGTFDQLTIGVGAHIYGDSEIYALNVIFGNFLRMNSRVKIDGYKDFKAGHNVWVGSDTTLNATGGLEIGNNTGIGEKCLIWSHGYWSDLLEGSNIFTIKKTTIGDECWVAAGTSITPGVKVANRVLMLPESNVVKSIEEENVVVGGNPAKKIQKIVGGQTIDLAHFSPKSREEKYGYLKQVLNDFCRRFQKVDLKDGQNYTTWDVLQGGYSGQLFLLLNENKDDDVVDLLSHSTENKEILVFSPHDVGSNISTNFNYMTRTHSSLLKNDGSYNLLALEFIKDSNTYIAKFIPQDGFYK
ncbi:hypothetical protein HYU22_00510 [Candidatus Woesearchaeota archaeon]|nr:hypothetical protein [Candidatus Woesearchaeota archaeon]